MGASKGRGSLVPDDPQGCPTAATQAPACWDRSGAMAQSTARPSITSPAAWEGMGSYRRLCQGEVLSLLPRSVPQQGSAARETGLSQSKNFFGSFVIRGTCCRRSCALPEAPERQIKPAARFWEAECRTSLRRRRWVGSEETVRSASGQHRNGYSAEPSFWLQRRPEPQQHQAAASCLPAKPSTACLLEALEASSIGKSDQRGT